MAAISTTSILSALPFDAFDDGTDDTALIPPTRPVPHTERALRIVAEACKVPEALAPAPSAVATKPDVDVERRVAEAFADSEPTTPAAELRESQAHTRVMHLGRLLAPSPVEAWRRRAARVPRPRVAEADIVLARGPGPTWRVEARVTSAPTREARLARTAKLALLGLAAIVLLVALARLAASSPELLLRAQHALAR